MARADLLLDLVEAERHGDRDRFRTLVEAVIAEERANQHHFVADRLSELITTTGQGLVRDERATAIRDLVHEVVPSRRLDDLELAPVPRRVVTELPGEECNDRERPDLLVIDDVDSYHEVAGLLPADPGAPVLLTSRTPRWGPPFTVINVGPLTASEALKLLRCRLPTLDSASASRMVEDLDGLPLALDLAASLVEQDSASGVLEELQAVETAAAAAENAGHGGYYLDTNDPRTISAFERAFADVVSPSRDVQLEPPERGSWKRRWSARYSDDRLEQLLDKAERAAGVAALTRPEGQSNRDNAEAIARLLEASSAIPNMVVASGSVLVIKLTDQSGAQVFCKTLTATELRRFEENQHLLSRPAEALAFLKVLGASNPVEVAGRINAPLGLRAE